MGKNHMKRITAPRTWRIHRKSNMFVTRPTPGAHSLDMGISINTFLKELAKITKTTKETKYLLTNQEVHVNGTRKRSAKHMVGFMDIINIPSAGKSFRLIINTKGDLDIKEEKQDNNKMLLKITGKTIMPGGTHQINTLGGRNLIVEEKHAKDYKTGDSVIITVPDNKVHKHIKNEKGAQALIIVGKHAGKKGQIEKIDNNIITIKTSEGEFQTNKNYVLITGKDKPELEI